MSVFFQPFVGKDYYNGGIFGKRIMVLGESLYCGEGCADCGNLANHRECAAFTDGVVNDYLNEDLDRERWMNTFLKFERSLVGHETGWAERKRIMTVNHPSVGYPWDWWHQVIKAFLE